MRKSQYLVSFDTSNGARTTRKFVAISKRDAKKLVLKTHPDAERIEVEFEKFVSV